MKIEELIEKVKFNKEMGLTRLILTMPEPKSGVGMSNRVRTPFGLAEVACVNSEGNVVFWIEIAKIEKWMKKALKELKNNE